MNPIVKPVSNNLVVFELTEEDRKKMRRVSLMDGLGNVADALMHKMCVMQLVSMLTSEADKSFERLSQRDDSYSDHPVCVSAAVADYLIALNDKTENVRQRNQLKKLVEEVMNTCPVRRTHRKDGTIVDTRASSREYTAAERQRRDILGQIDEYYDKHDKSMPFSKQVEVIREAAALFRVQATVDPIQDTPTTTGEVA